MAATSASSSDQRKSGLVLSVSLAADRSAISTSTSASKRTDGLTGSRLAATTVGTTSSRVLVFATAGSATTVTGFCMTS
eukprot:CAMPEP_0205927506 /NCGR_PEP_ID=MMETSP1325-20131115/22748_1 /ASSEMBLY_ACC=CAM_ASM_000708 /TAXON_ID=236786 /ORGANISM="Florenciella sp., Strain RCC1007" /LENGTH=78 /DNA_ID=CAMNT_0053296391 /DNA_START=80 /DNA_END=313 /DNA_ORIENTATION=+